MKRKNRGPRPPKPGPKIVMWRVATVASVSVLKGQVCTSKQVFVVFFFVSESVRADSSGFFPLKWPQLKMIGPKIQARFPQSMLIKKPVPPLPKNVWLWQLPNWCMEKTIRWVAWRSHSSGSGDEKPKKSQVSLGIRPFWCSWKKPKVVQIVNGGSVFYLWKVIFTHQKSWESFSEFLWFSQMIGGHASPYRNTPLGLKWHNFNTHKPLIVRHSPSSKGPTPPKMGNHLHSA